MKANILLDLEHTQQKYREAFSVGGIIQKYIDSTVLKGVEPYVPMRIGTLTKSGILHTKIGSGKIVWRTPYARYLWYGKSRRGKDLVFSVRRHPLAGKMWAERYKADHLSTLQSMVKRKVATL